MDELQKGSVGGCLLFDFTTAVDVAPREREFYLLSKKPGRKHQMM